MRYAIIESGVITNVVLGDEAWAAAHPDAVQLPDDSRAGPGWAWVNGAAVEPPPPPPVVPDKVTKRQARQAMVKAGIAWAAVQAKIDAMAEPQRSLTQSWWDDSNDYERHNATLVAMATQLGLDSAALDALFILAASL